MIKSSGCGSGSKSLQDRSSLSSTASRVSITLFYKRSISSKTMLLDSVVMFNHWVHIFSSTLLSTQETQLKNYKIADINFESCGGVGTYLNRIEVGLVRFSVLLFSILLISFLNLSSSGAHHLLFNSIQNQLVLTFTTNSGTKPANSGAEPEN